MGRIIFIYILLLQVGTGRYRRSHKYHDKNVDKVWVSDNGYMVTVSTGSKFVKIWKVTHGQEDGSCYENY